LTSQYARDELRRNVDRELEEEETRQIKLEHARERRRRVLYNIF